MVQCYLRVSNPMVSPWKYDFSAPLPCSNNHCLGIFELESKTAIVNTFSYGYEDFSGILKRLSEQKE